MSIEGERGEWPSTVLPNTWQWLDFSEFWIDHTDASRKVPEKLYASEGALAVIDQGANLVGGFTDDLSKKSPAPLPAIVFGDHTRTVKYIDHPFAQGADGVRVFCAAPFVDPRFAYHALNCVNLPDKGYSRHFKFLKVTPFPLAPLPEQQRIVAKIDSLSAKSRRARDRLDHIPRLVEKYKQAILAAAFRGELTRDCQEHHDDNPTGNVSGAPWAAPSLWRWLTIAEAGEVSLGRQRSPKDHMGPQMRRYVRAANITWGGWSLTDVKEMNFDDKEFARFKLKAGDVLVNEGSGSAKEVGKPAIWRDDIADCCFQNTLLRVRPVVCSSEFLYFFFLFCALTGQFVSSTQGVNIFHIGKEGLAKFPIPVPPRGEQDQIVRRIETAFTWINRLANEVTSARKLIEHLDQAVLAKAFRGELVPQDPNDEPASVLLERIRAERVASGPVKRSSRGKRKAPAKA